jgi:hypothetical protein
MYVYRPVSNCLQFCSSDRSGEDSLAPYGRRESKASLAGRLQDRAAPGRQEHEAQEQENQEAMETDEVVSRAGGSQEPVHNKLTTNSGTLFLLHPGNDYPFRASSW